MADRINRALAKNNTAIIGPVIRAPKVLFAAFGKTRSHRRISQEQTTAGQDPSGKRLELCELAHAFEVCNLARR